MCQSKRAQEDNQAVCHLSFGHLPLAWLGYDLSPMMVIFRHVALPLS